MAVTERDETDHSKEERISDLEKEEEEEEKSQPVPLNRMHSLNNGDESRVGISTTEYFPHPTSSAALATHTFLLNSTRGMRRFTISSEDDGAAEEDGREEEEEEEGEAPDGGWGWFVAIGALIISILLPTLGPCFGILFSPLLIKSGASSTTIAWIFNVMGLCWNFTGPTVGPMSNQFGFRVVAVAGSLLVALGLFMSAFVTAPAALFFTFSILAGIGGGMSSTVGYFIIPKYFVKRRGLANAFMMAGICIGQIIAPPTVKFLQDIYLFRGATVILSGVILNACVGAALYQPVEWHLKNKRKKPVSMKVSENCLEKTAPVKFSSMSDSLNKYSKLEKGPVRERLLLKKKLQEHCPSSRGSYASITSFKRSFVALSSLDLTSLSSVAAYDAAAENGKARDSEEMKSLCAILYAVAKNIVSDMKILRNYRAIIISVSCVVIINGYLNFIMMVPFAMQFKGQSLQDAALCVSVSAVANLLARVTASVLSDSSWFNIRLIYRSGILLLASSTLAFSLSTNYALQIGVIASWGCGVGFVMSLHSLVMIDTMGVDLMPAMFGATSFSVGCGNILVGTFLGVIRDASGSYDVTMQVIAGLTCIAFVLWFFMPLAIAADERSRAKVEGGVEPEVNL
ncbi:monocarboxylate transporter 5-like [Oratosquilla oratoria]|uniref:monocarboxylate transporter 5-like n=1 Tax=Oratosquilla oratoria TaxID=337810 RepID=UPI003F75C71F